MSDQRTNHLIKFKEGNEVVSLWHNYVCIIERVETHLRSFLLKLNDCKWESDYRTHLIRSDFSLAIIQFSCSRKLICFSCLRFAQESFCSIQLDSFRSQLKNSIHFSHQNSVICFTQLIYDSVTTAITSFSK